MKSVYRIFAVSSVIASVGWSQPADGVTGTLEHQVLATGSGRVALFEKDGTVLRTAKTGNNADAWYLENGNILFADGKVAEVDKEGKIVWEYKPDCKRADGAMSCQRLANGNTVVGENGTEQVTEVDKAGKVVFTLKIKPQVKKNPHHVMRMCRKLDNGNYLVCHSGDHIVREYKPDGTVVFEYTCKSIAFAAVRLPNGNTMISSLDQVEEVTPKGEVVWSFSKTDLPDLSIRNMTGIHVLKSGNMIIGNYSAYDKKAKTGVGMFEITREKKLVWAYVSPEFKDGSMMAVQKLDGDFNPLR
jgi:outer membrane protein assembly factor BamB